MQRLSYFVIDGKGEPTVMEYPHPSGFWSDWNGLLGNEMWHRTETAPDGSRCTVKWKSETFRNGDGKVVVSTHALWVDGEHPADTRPRPEPQDEPEIPATQAGRASIGERLRSPHGEWTVTRSWIADRPNAPEEDRDYRSSAVISGSGRTTYYLLTHADGHQEEWSAPDMADAGFHRILPDQQQTLI
jgi:hypothetical protein